MHPAFLDNLSWEMAEVYGAITDQILINLARHFPFYQYVDDIPTSAFTYQAQMLAQMGQVSKETIQIIRNGLSDADLALQGVLEQAVIDAVKSSEPELLEAVKKGVFTPNTMPVLSPNQTRAFKLYYEQAADKLNLVNTVMLESTQSAYTQAVSDVVSQIEIADRIGRTQQALDVAAGETITGVSSWNAALKHATDRMKEGGVCGFIDHAGRRWSAEAYTAMDIRTTVFNTGRAAVWETNQNFGNDLYIVSYHNGARPLCYPYQNMVISRDDRYGVTYDLDGNEIHFIAQSATSYGQPAGLFGINCKHYPTPFIPGVSVIEGKPQDPDANAKTYEESQKQRELERKLREEKRDLMMAKAQGADEEEINRLRGKCRETSEDIDEFCKETGRARHRDREAVYTKREFPDADRYDVSKFEKDQKKLIDDYYKAGGEQQNYTFGQMTPNEPIVKNVASQATQATPPNVQSQKEAFVPAKNRAEAEQYAREHFADVVTYNGSITVDTMNTINSELKDLTDEYPIDKLRKITQNGRMNALARANGGWLDVNGKKIDVATGGADYARRQEYARKRLEYLRQSYPDGIPKAWAKEAQKYEEILKFSRWTIDDAYETTKKVRATISHEYGHILADQYCGQINGRHFCKTYGQPETLDKKLLITNTYKKAKANGDIYKLSEYGASNDHEFFAEVFSAYWMKEPLPEYFFDMIRAVVK